MSAESHNSLLEEIRILSELEHGAKLLQLVLVGQPEFETKLAEPEMYQLQQRVSVRCGLGPLATADVGAYVVHRLAIAGAHDALFAEDAIPLIAAASGGIPRVINLLCDRALTRAATDDARVFHKTRDQRSRRSQTALFNGALCGGDRVEADTSAPAVETDKTSDLPVCEPMPVAERGRFLPSRPSG